MGDRSQDAPRRKRLPGEIVKEDTFTLDDWIMGLQSAVSLLVSEGHGQTAYDYPVGLVWDEVAICVTRRNLYLASEMALLRSAISSVMDRKAANEFSKTLKKLTKEDGNG